MKRYSHFSGVETGSLGLKSQSGVEIGSVGLKLPEFLTAGLPAASAANKGVQVIITDNGVGDNEYAIVVSNGTAWTLTTGAALT